MSTIVLVGGESGLEYRIGRLTPEFHQVSPASAVANPMSLVHGPVPPDVLLLGPELDRSHAISIASFIDGLGIATSVVIVATPTSDLVLEAMRAGVRDVIDPDADDDAMRTMLIEAREYASRRSAVAGEPGPGGNVDGRVIVIASPKGGVGKSTIAVNTAVGLAAHSHAGVVLVDLDLQFGDVATHLDLTPQHTVSDVFASQGGLDTMVLKTYLTQYTPGLWVLSAPESPAAADEISGKQIRELLETLAREFTYVVVDTGAGLDEPTLAALEEATDVVFIASMDVAGVRNVRKEVEVLNTLGILPMRRHLVVNLADKKAGMSPKDVSEVVGLPITAVVPRAQEIAFAVNKGVPLLTERKPSQASAKPIRAVVDAMMGQEASK